MTIKHPAKKILLIADHIGIGGIPRYCKDLVRKQSLSDAEFVMAAMVAEEQDVQEYPPELTHPILSYGTADIGVMERIREVINFENPDYILTQGYKSNIMTWLASLRYRIKTPMATVQHGILFPMHGRESIYFKADICLRRLLQIPTVAVSHDTATQLINNWKILRRLVRVLHNPLEVPSRISKPQNKIFTIGFASRLLKEKGVLDLLEAFLMLDNKKLKLLIAGDGPLLETLKKDVLKNRLEEKIIFEGSLDDMTSFYRKLDLFVFPSWGEGLPYVVAEAMSHGVATVATEVGGIPELIDDGVNGYLVPAQDVQALSKAIKGCMADKKSLRIVARNGRKKTAALSFDDYYRKLLLFLDTFTANTF